MAWRLVGGIDRYSVAVGRDRLAHRLSANYNSMLRDGPRAAGLYQSLFGRDVADGNESDSSVPVDCCDSDGIRLNCMGASQPRA